jgi:N-carbamoylputrescine amidase
MTADVRELRVAAVQMESENGAVEANLERATPFADEAAGKGAKLVIFPEFMPTGYIFTREIWDGAEPSDGPTMVWLAENSKRLDIYLGTSFLEAQGGDFFNTFVITGPDGEVAGRVRKQKPAAAEAYFFRGEKGSHVIETEIGTIGVGICYENQLAFTPGLMYGHSADIVLMPHSAPAPTPAWWLHRKRSQAIADILRKLPVYYANVLGVPVVLINKTGPFTSPVPGMPFYPQNSRFPGESTIADSDGSILERLGAEEGIAVADVHLEEALKARSAPPRYGRWSMEIPVEIYAFITAEAAGRASYSLSSERKKKAREISSPAGRRGNQTQGQSPAVTRP